MAEVSSPVSLLPWIWTIETLASDREVETSFIYDAIEMAPQLPNDLGKNMREMVALRCLEGLYGPSNGSGNEVSILLDSNVRFDPSKSCENVLQSIFGKAPSNRTMAQSEVVNLDVHSFISHKRASMPKCTLQQLKDDILGGTHQYAVALRGISGLSYANECPTIPSDSEDHITLAHRLCKSRTGAQNNRATGNLVPQTLENGNKQSEKVSLKVDPSLCERDRFEMATEKVAGDISKSQYDVKAKKRKHSGSSSITSEDGPCKNLTVNAVENRGMSLVEPQTSNGVPVKGIHHDIHRPGGTFKRGFQLGTPNNTSNDDSQKKFITDEYKRSTGDCRHAEKLSNADIHDTGRIDIVTMKNQCLSSQFTSHDSSVLADWTEQSLCVKCHEGGQLLVCSAYGCGLMVHENCLGSSARFDNQGNFCCPFCSYSIVISEYLEAKKKASLARNRLAAFIGPTFEPHSRGLYHRVHAKEYNPRQSENEDIGEVVQNGQLRETEGNQIDCTGGHVNEVNSHHVQQCTHDKQQSESLSSQVKVNLPCRKEANVSSPTGHVSSSEEEGEDMMAQGCPDVRGTGEKGQVPADHVCDNGKFPRENRETIHVNRRCIERRHELEKKFDNENDKLITSIVFNKRRRKKINYTYPAIPHLRRLRLPFTAKEEEMIKVGVGRFANGNEKTIPWKDILEFGANVFVKGRTTTDLKDKWRNMCRGSP